MNIIGIIASPRKKGNTTFIVNQILEGAKEKGAQTLTFDFSHLDIKPCLGCNGCKNNNRGCIVNDDMQKIYDALEHADAIVLGSPIYMGQMSAQGKVFTDRLYARFSPRFSPFFKENIVRQKLILSFNQGNPDATLFKPYIEYTKQMFEMLEFDVKVVPVITDMRNGMACEREGLGTSLKTFGSTLVNESGKI